MNGGKKIMVVNRTITGTLPSGHDQYFTNFKTKYLTGIVVSNATFSVATSGCSLSTASYHVRGGTANTEIAGKLPCDVTFPIVTSTGSTYYVPCFKYGAGV